MIILKRIKFRLFSSFLTFTIIISIISGCTDLNIKNTAPAKTLASDDPSDLTGFAAMVNMGATRKTIAKAKADTGFIGSSEFLNGTIVFKPGNKFYGNYFTIEYTTNKYLRCVLRYAAKGQEREEEFFLISGKKQLEFSSFIGNNNKDLREITLKSLYVEDGSFAQDGGIDFKLGELSFKTKEKFPDMIYLENDRYKLGIDMKLGGAISYLEDVKNKPVIVKENGRFEITTDSEGKEIVFKNVNLVNRHDAGRLIQQSYYGGQAPSSNITEVSAVDGYVFGEFGGNKWVYNPVQGGDQSFKSSPKIIDYDIISDNSVYIKCRPYDWGHTESSTPSYMENTYTLVNDTVKVENQFTDYSKYLHREAGQELPAMFIIEPFRTAWYPIKKENDKLIMGKWETRDERGYHISVAPATFGAWSSDTGNYGIGLSVSLSGLSYHANGYVLNQSNNYDSTPDYANAGSYLSFNNIYRHIQGVPFKYTYHIITGNIDTLYDDLTISFSKQ